MAADTLKAKIQARTRGPAYHVGSQAQPIQPTAIRTDGGTQARAELHAATIVEYAEAMQAGAQFPPVIVYYDGTDYWLADGFHRTEAARRSGTTLTADIRPGTRRDAVLWAVGANDAHGLRRTRADIQRAIETLLRDSEWGQWSDREIARQVHCHHNTVAAARDRLSGEISQIEARTVERRGSRYTQQPRQPKPTPAPAAATPAPAAATPAPAEPPMVIVFQLRATAAQARGLQLQASALTSTQRHTIAQELASLIAILEEVRSSLEA